MGRAQRVRTGGDVVSIATAPNGRLDIAAGDHICAITAGQAERDAVVGSFLGDGLTAGDKCLLGLADPDPWEVVAGIDGAGGLGGYRDSQQLELLGSDDTKFRPAEFSIPHMFDFWGEVIGKSVGQGYQFTRLSAEAAWWGPQLPGDEALIEYESALNTFNTAHPVAILCLYDSGQCSGSLIMDVIKTHPRTLLNGLVFDNPYYLDPDALAVDRRSRR
jgi:hypothetical protein